MKKLLALLLAMSFCACMLTGCSSSKPPETTSPDVSGTSEPTNEPSEQPSELAFPEGTITITIPWAAGGAVDLFIRQIADSASQIAGIPMVVENNTGAGGTVAATQYLDNNADGYNVLVAAAPVVFYQPYVRDVVYTAEDFAPFLGLQKAEIFLVVSADSGIETIDDFKAAAESGHFTWGSAGAGTIDYVAQSALAGALGITANNVTYESAAEQVTAIVGGNLDAACAITGSFEEYVKSGDLNVIACYSDADIELDGIGTVPCLKTLGYDVTCSNFYFLLAMAGTDPAVVQKLYEIFNAALETDSVKDYIAAMELDMNPLGPEEMQEYFTQTYVEAQELFG